MQLKHGIEIKDQAVIDNFERLQNLIFKLLPSREEGKDWETPLSNLFLEVGGLASLLDNQISLLVLLSKMEALTSLTNDDDFFVYRKLIFECLSELTRLKKNVYEL